MRYQRLEAEMIEEMYEEGYSAKAIAEQVNKDFHKGEPVRNERSVYYVIGKIYNGDGDSGWYRNLEVKWLENIS